jgi:hypothetical protein
MRGRRMYRPFKADAIHCNRIDTLEPLLPLAMATLVQLASPLPWADLLSPFGAKTFVGPS